MAKDPDNYMMWDRNELLDEVLRFKEERDEARDVVRRILSTFRPESPVKQQVEADYEWARSDL